MTAILWVHPIPQTGLDPESGSMACNATRFDIVAADCQDHKSIKLAPSRNGSS
ncbi:MAG: hypothetical protein V4569_13530 [Pseudomonadota bacterium]